MIQPETGRPCGCCRSQDWHPTWAAWTQRAMAARPDSFDSVTIGAKTRRLPVYVTQKSGVFNPRRANTGAVTFLVLGCIAFGVYVSNHWAITQILAGPHAAGRWTSLQNGIGTVKTAYDFVHDLLLRPKGWLCCIWAPKPFSRTI